MHKKNSADHSGVGSSGPVAPAGKSSRTSPIRQPKVGGGHTRGVGTTSHKTGGGGMKNAQPKMGGPKRSNSQRMTRQGFKESDGAHEGRSSNMDRAKRGKTYSSNYGASGGKRANFQDADNFLGQPNDNKLTSTNSGTKARGGRGTKAPQFSGPRKGTPAPPVVKRPKGMVGPKF